jgi:hypothetical protein
MNQSETCLLRNDLDSFVPPADCNLPVCGVGSHFVFTKDVDEWSQYWSVCDGIELKDYLNACVNEFGFRSQFELGVHS